MIDSDKLYTYFSIYHGPGQRIEDLVPYWRKMLELYEPIIEKLC